MNKPSKKESENELTVVLAGRARRSFAFLLDMILIVTFVLMMLKIFIIPQQHPGALDELQHLAKEYGDTPGMTQTQLMEKLSPELLEMIQTSQAYMLFFLWMYFAISEMITKGSSLGKKVFSMRVVNANTLEPPTFFDSILRSGLKTLSLLSWIPIFIVNCFLIFVTKKRQSGHDLLTRTVVIEGNIYTEVNTEK